MSAVEHITLSHYVNHHEKELFSLLSLYGKYTHILHAYFNYISSSCHYSKAFNKLLYNKF